jgi:hypothetical protein
MRFADVVKFTRQNTGRHFLDSGDYYGRAYETPVPENMTEFDKYGTPVLSLTHVIAETCEFHDTHAQFYDSDFKPTRDGVLDFMEKRRHRLVSHDNTYNYDGDLDQCAEYMVFVPEDQGSDEWYYNDDSVLVVFSHNGCDVRGGYSDPMFLESNGAYSEIPFVMSTTLSLYSEELDEDENERLYSGYSGYPMGQLEELEYEFVETNDDGSATFKGPKGLITVYAEYHG